MALPRRLRIAFVPAAIAIVLVAIAGACAPAAAQAPAAVGVRVDAVRSVPLAQTVPITGRLVALQSGAVAARIGGAVDEVRVRVGDRVAKGDLLVVLDAERVTAERDLRAAELAAAEAQLATVQAELALRRQELDRLEALRRSPAFPEARTLDQRKAVTIAEGVRANAEAAVVRARAQLRLAEINLADSQIRAPYAGVVTRRQADVGARLDEGAAAVSLIDDTLLEIEIDVPAQRLAGVRPGTTVTALLDEIRLDAAVRAVLPEENPMTRTRTVRLRGAFPPGSDLAADRSVVVLVPTGAPRAALTVHKDAVLYRTGGTFVFVDDGGAARLQKISLGEATGTRFEVVDGLADGDRVVVRGNERLQPGQALTVEPERRG